jgi:hypothetical protein
MNNRTGNHVTANQLSGRATGAIFFACFGSLWLGLSLYVRQLLTPATGISLALALLSLLLTSIWLLGEAKSWPSLPEDPAKNRAFHRINLAQWIAVAIAGFTFSRLHLDTYVISAITAIVGLHMFPLARLFRYPMHYVTGAALTGWAAISCIFIPSEYLQGITAMGTGILLWLSAACTLILAIGLTRKPVLTRRASHV